MLEEVSGQLLMLLLVGWEGVLCYEKCPQIAMLDTAHQCVTSNAVRLLVGKVFLTILTNYSSGAFCYTWSWEWNDLLLCCYIVLRNER